MKEKTCYNIVCLKCKGERYLYYYYFLLILEQTHYLQYALKQNKKAYNYVWKKMSEYFNNIFAS